MVDQCWSRRRAGKVASTRLFGAGTSTKAESLKGLIKFASQNRLPVVWATTRSQFGTLTVDGSKIRQWPAAVLAFSYGVRAVRGRLAGYEAQVKGVVETE